jgi:formylglycine-generating enzyme required for sulfatase activity
LEPRGVGVLTFPHRTFQEYLAACFLTDHNFPDDLVNLVQADPLRWREVALLAGAKASHGTAAAVWLLADALCDKDCTPEWTSDIRRIEPYFWAVLIAAQVLVENKSLAHISERNQVKLERIRQWLTFTLTHGLLPPLDRVAAGRALGLIGDLRDLEEMIQIPAGKFWLGDKKESPSRPLLSNAPPQQIDLATYRIGKYPVTVGQWRQFVEATGHQGDPRTLTDPDNHPARWVSWLDAQAYCQWLTVERRTAHQIDALEVVRLPTEAEWEKAARGTDRRAWPWGDEFDQDRANTSELGAGTTSAVGCFPAGASHYGCLDMAGNVWEWTQSRNTKYPYRVDDGRKKIDERLPRVVRGGSWADYRDYARCAYRYGDRPVARYVGLGFRCVVSAGSRF